MMRKKLSLQADRSMGIEHFSRSQSWNIVMAENNAAKTTAADVSTIPDAKQVPDSSPYSHGIL